MDTAAFETDPMLRLLTDALRRGPGSPEWHDAVTRLRDASGPDTDEYQLLIAARERLESGREYREVRAGPAFTRELFGAIDAAPAKVPSPNFGKVLRIACLVTLIVAVGVVATVVLRPGQPAAQELSGRLFVTRVHDWSFASMPKDLQHVGGLPLEARGNGLRAGGRDTIEPMLGLLYADDPLDLARGTCVEMRLDYKPGPTSAALVLQRDPLDSSPSSTTLPGLAIVCDASGARLTSPDAASTPRPLPNGSHLLRIKVVGEDAVAEVDGQAIWTGRQTLGRRAFVGVRLVRDGKAGDVAVQSLRVLAP